MALAPCGPHDLHNQDAEQACFTPEITSAALPHRTIFRRPIPLPPRRTEASATASCARSCLRRTASSPPQARTFRLSRKAAGISGSRGTPRRSPTAALPLMMTRPCRARSSFSGPFPAMEGPFLREKTVCSRYEHGSAVNDQDMSVTREPAGCIKEA